MTLSGVIVRQVAAIPFRYDALGNLEVLLVTSRRSRRWVLPKGRVRRLMLPHVAAAHEAFEEAGVLGVIERVPITEYRQQKHVDGGTSSILVAAYPMAVNTELTAWPEKHLRRRMWMAVPEAIEAVRDVDLTSAIQEFARAIARW